MWDTVAVVIQILGSHVFHHIIMGQMMLVESALVGAYYGWAHMLLSLLK